MSGTYHLKVHVHAVHTTSCVWQNEQLQSATCCPWGQQLCSTRNQGQPAFPGECHWLCKMFHCVSCAERYRSYPCSAWNHQWMCCEVQLDWMWVQDNAAVQGWPSISAMVSWKKNDNDSTYCCQDKWDLLNSNWNFVAELRRVTFRCEHGKPASRFLLSQPHEAQLSILQCQRINVPV